MLAAALKELLATVGESDATAAELVTLNSTVAQNLTETF